MADDVIGPQLARTLGDLAVRMQGKVGGEDTLRSIAEAAAVIVPGARWAGISLIEGARVIAYVPTDPAVAKLDELQSELGDGPCISALRDFPTVHIVDMSQDTRWPEFSSLATQLGIGSLLSFQLFVEQDNLGALNLYGGEAGVFAEDSVEIGTILAQHAAVALAATAKEGQFATALASRDLIGQAKGILMYRENLTGLQAFNLMVKTSQKSNIKLVDLAEWLIEEHEKRVLGE